jgi:hypothetical protein
VLFEADLLRSKLAKAIAQARAARTAPPEEVKQTTKAAGLAVREVIDAVAELKEREPALTEAERRSLGALNREMAAAFAELAEHAAEVLAAARHSD